MIADGCRVFAFPYSGYWVDVGTINTYWKAHMDLLNDPPSIDLNNRSWIIHTRTEERPPVRIFGGAEIVDSLLANGCVIEPGARVIRSVLSPGVTVKSGSVVVESILLTGATIENDVTIQRAILDKKVVVGGKSRIGGDQPAGGNVVLTMVGKNSIIPANSILEAGATVGTDVIPSDFPELLVKSDAFIKTKRLPNEV